MKSGKWLLTLPAVLLAHCVYASPDRGSNSSISYALTPTLLGAKVIPTKKNGLKEVRMHSGVGVSLSNPLLNVSVDYKLRGSMKNTARSDVAQVLSTALRSGYLNSLFGMNASIKAVTTIKSGGNGFRYQLSPSIHKNLSNLARLDLKYSYILDKPSPVTSARETRDYSVGVRGKFNDGLAWHSKYSIKQTLTEGRNQAPNGRRTKDYTIDLNGRLDEGRLTWRSTYKASDSLNTSGGPDEKASQESVDLKTRYQINRDLLIELTSAVKHRELAQADRSFSKTLLGAGLSWSPLAEYSLALKVNKVSQTQQIDYLRSGTLVWHPERHLAFSLGYGDQLVEGTRGFMLSTKVDLD